VLTDTHCHLNINNFDSDRDEVIQRAKSAGLTRILIPGITLASSRLAAKLATTHPMLYSAVGVHPNDAETWDAQTLSALTHLAITNIKVKAIGEIGLDYYWNSSTRETQIDILQNQLRLASELQLPVVLHFREKGDMEHGTCGDDLLKILEKWVDELKSTNQSLGERPGVLHSFSGSLEIAQHAINLGFYIGVTGPITYKNAENRRTVITNLPLERLLIETDAPFLAPVPHRGKRNEPAFVTHIADKIAAIKSHTPQEIAALTTANAARLFAWEETV
jgi:TatD DNase family protein